MLDPDLVVSEGMPLGQLGKADWKNPFGFGSPSLYLIGGWRWIVNQLIVLTLNGFQYPILLVEE